MKPEELRTLRDAANLSQQALADKLQCHRSAIAKWERGDREINKITELAIRALLKEQTDGDI